MCDQDGGAPAPSIASTDVVFDATAYSVDAIQRALYRMSDRLSGGVRLEGGEWHCTLYAVDADALLDEFRNQVLDEVLRERIRAQTETTRNLILALAFSETGLVEGETTG